MLPVIASRPSAAPAPEARRRLLDRSRSPRPRRSVRAAAARRRAEPSRAAVAAGRSPTRRSGRTDGPGRHAPADRPASAWPRRSPLPRDPGRPRPPRRAHAQAYRRVQAIVPCALRRVFRCHVAVAYCPYCAKLLDPAPTTSKRCDHCRQRIVVKRIDGTPRFLTEAAVLVFEAERRRVLRTRRAGRAIGTAGSASRRRPGQPRRARRRSSRPPDLTEDVVAAARKLYLTTVDRAFRAARAARDWEAGSPTPARRGRGLYRVAGSPRRLSADVVDDLPRGRSRRAARRRGDRPRGRARERPLLRRVSG